MRLIVSSLLVCTVALSGCSRIADSKVNPANWFSKRQSSHAQTENTNPLIPKNERNGLFSGNGDDEVAYLGQPIDFIKDLKVEKTPTGLILTAKAVSQVQNIHSVQLTAEQEDGMPINGVLSYRLEGVKPNQPLVGGAERLRTVVAAIALDKGQLKGLRRIEIKGKQNTRTVRVR